jgi:hypothetical protein
VSATAAATMTVTEEHDVVEHLGVVRVEGPVSLVDVRLLRRSLLALLAGGRRRIVLDLTAAGEVPQGHLVLMLLGLRQEAASRGARIVLAPPEATFARLSGSPALLGIVDVARSVEAAASA